jgi:hypothetical protein
MSVSDKSRPSNTRSSPNGHSPKAEPAPAPSPARPDWEQLALWLMTARSVVADLVHTARDLGTTRAGGLLTEFEAGELMEFASHASDADSYLASVIPEPPFALPEVPSVNGGAA